MLAVSRPSRPRVRFVVLSSMIVASAVLRLIPHPPNWSTVGGMALFAGAHFSSLASALAVPMLSMLASDLILESLGRHGIHSGMPVVYACFALAVLLGRRLRSRRRPLRILATATASSVLFFVATNLSVWAFSDLYTRDPRGLGACFVAALPFFQNTLAGDLFTVGALFGAFALARRRWHALDPSTTVVGSR